MSSTVAIAVAAGVTFSSAGCTAAGRHAYRTHPLPTGAGLTARVIPFVHCPGNVDAELYDWGSTRVWNRVGPAVAMGVIGRRTTLGVFRSAAGDRFGEAVLCSRRGTRGRLHLSVHMDLRSPSPSDVQVSVKSLAAWNDTEDDASRTFRVGRVWSPVRLDARLDARRAWYAVYVTSTADTPFFVRRPQLRFAAR